MVKFSQLRIFFITFLTLLGLSILSWKVYINTAFDSTSFVTNNRQDGEARVTVSNGIFKSGELEDGGMPVVKLDWLSKPKDFRDENRTVIFYKDSALGDPKCAPFILQSPPGGFINRGGKSYTLDNAAFSLDRWTGFLLSTREPKCHLTPGDYVMVTEYNVPILWGLEYVKFSFTSNIFTILESEEKFNG